MSVEAWTLSFVLLISANQWLDHKILIKRLDELERQIKELTKDKE